MSGTMTGSSEEERRKWIPDLSDATQEIRLLRLPDELGREGEIALKLATFPLNEAPSYHALSYTWGCPVLRPTKEQASRYETEMFISCNDQQILIKRNLYEGLREIIRQFPGILLWNDALCIDQQRPEEVNLQIRLLGRIYHSAETVIVWLGQGTERIEPFYKLYADAGPRFAAAAQAVRSRNDDRTSKIVEGGQEWHGAILGELRKLGVRPEDMVRGSTAAMVLPTCSWFHRKWTFQEVVLARRDIILYGRYRFELDAILQVARFAGFFWEKFCGNFLSQTSDTFVEQRQWELQFKRLSSVIEIRKQIGQPFVPGSDAAAFLNHVCGSRHPPAVMMLLVRASSPGECLLQGDHFASLQGLLQMLNADVEVAEKHFLSVNDDEGYPISMAYNIEFIKVPYLPSLSFADGFEEAAPSWPTWWLYRYQYQRDFLRPFIDQAYNSQGPFFHASTLTQTGSFENEHKMGTVSSKVSEISAQEVRLGLFLRAIRVGFIRAVKKLDLPAYQFRHLGNHGESGPRFGKRCLDAFTNFLQGLPKRLRSGLTSSETLWRTLTIDIGEDSCYPARDQDRNYFFHWACVVSFQALEAEEPVQEMTWSVVRRLTRDFLMLFIPEDWSEAMALHYLKDLSTRLIATRKPGSDSSEMAAMAHVQSRWLFPERPLFLLDDDMIGLGPRSMAAYDEVWVIEGARVPFVLRRTAEPGQYLLIGEAYVHGIMNGELIKQQGDDVEWNEICIV